MVEFPPRLDALVQPCDGGITIITDLFASFVLFSHSFFLPVLSP